MITDTEYMQLISETYDLSDYTTKKKLLFCNEAQRIVNVEHIVNNLYLHIKNNVSGIDFGTIPKSKGVVTQIENYAGMQTFLTASTLFMSWCTTIRKEPIFPML